MATQAPVRASKISGTYLTWLNTMTSNIEKAEDNSTSIWEPLRKFLVFQLKLYIEAFRDVILSGIALLTFLLDLVFQLKGEDSLFEKLLQLGRRSERAINLFNQHDEEELGKDSVDGLVREVESRLRKDFPRK